MKLQGQTTVITGGNSGIGLAIAKEFNQHGANVVIFGRNQTTLDEAAKEIGDGTLRVQGDVTRLDDIDRLYKETAERFGRIDVLVANAGIGKFLPIESFTEELFDEVCDINFKGAFFSVQRALPYLRDGASVVLLSSAGSSTHGQPLTSVYTATKAAVRSLARTLSAELLPRRIRVNALSPGMTETPILSRDIGLSAKVRDDIAKAVVEEIPVKRPGAPEEMAKAALFLASSDSSYCVGAEITVDGGLCQI